MGRFSARTIYLVLAATFALAHATMFTTYALYYVVQLGLTPVQLVLVGTALEVTIVLFEIPTGVVADLYSRRLSVIIGTFVLAGAYLLEGSLPLLGGLLPFFAGVVMAEVIRGVGETFISGARQAWIADEVGTDQLGGVLLRSAQVERVMSFLGIGLGVGLAHLGLNLPYLAGGLMLTLLGIVLTVAMPEQAFTPVPRADRSTWGAMRATFVDGLRTVRGRPVLLALLAITLVAGAASEGFARLWEAHLLLTFSLADVSSLSPATWFGLLAAAGALLGMLTAWQVERRLDLAQPRQVSGSLLATAGLRTASLLAFALAPSLGWAVAALLLLGVLDAVYYPVYDTWLNRQIESRSRATVLSIMGQGNAVGQSGGGPLVGWVGNRFGLRAALGVAAALLAPTLGLFARANRQSD